MFLNFFYCKIFLKMYFKKNLLNLRIIKVLKGVKFMICILVVNVLIYIFLIFKF